MAVNLESCPFCKGEVQLQMIGDMKHLLIYECENKSCFRTPLHTGDARSTKRDARKIWNKRVEERSHDNAEIH